MKTVVVNINHRQQYDVYLGRTRHGTNIFECPMDIRANDIGRQRMVELYREYVFANPDIVEACRELKGKRLGCYCAPKACHGDVLAEIADSFPDEKEESGAASTSEVVESAETWEAVQQQCRPL